MTYREIRELLNSLPDQHPQLDQEIVIYQVEGSRFNQCTLDILDDDLVATEEGLESTKKVKVIRGDVKSMNGRIYSSELLQEMTKQINSKPVWYGGLGHSTSTTVPLYDVSHTFKNASITGPKENKVLEVDITLLNTPKGKELQKILDNCVFRVKGIGDVNEDGIVSSGYTLTSIDAILKNDDPYKGLI